MNKNISSRPLLVATLALMVVATSFFGFRSGASAKAANITGVNNVSRRSVVLNISSGDLQNQTVTVKITIKNERTGKEKVKTMTTSLGSDGSGTVTIKRLKPGTQYTFTVAVGPTNGNLGDPSNSQTVTTLNRI